MEIDGKGLTTSELARTVEIRFETEFGGKFPYQDCYKIQRRNPVLGQSLIPDLDMYFGFIAGYSSSAQNLGRRPSDELQKAMPRLRRSFFDAHPQYKTLIDLITPTDTPQLYHRLQVADGLRQDLALLIERLGEGGPR